MLPGCPGGRIAAGAPIMSDLSAYAHTPAAAGETPNTFSVPVFFTGTVTDNDTLNTCDPDFTNCLYLNNIGIVFDMSDPSYTSTFLSLDNDPFLDNIAGILSDDGPGSGGSGAFYQETGTIFGIALAPNTPLGVYTGEVSIYGGIDDPDAGNLLATEPFTVTVVAPEPAPIGLAMLGLGAIWMARRRGSTA